MPVDRAALEERINTVRDQMKVKAFEALVEGRRLQTPTARTEADSVGGAGNLDADAGLPDELDALIERMLGGE
jgi:hypothetical protein